MTALLGGEEGYQFSLNLACPNSDRLGLIPWLLIPGLEAFLSSTSASFPPPSPLSPRPRGDTVNVAPPPSVWPLLALSWPRRPSAPCWRSSLF